MKYSRDNMFTEKQDLTNSPAGDPYQDSTYGRLDLRLYGILIGVYSIFLLLAFYKTYYFLKKRGMTLQEMPVELFVLDWVTIVLFIFFVAWSTKKLLNSTVRWKTILVFHFLLAFLVNVGIRFFIEAYTFLRGGREITFSELLKRYLAYIDINFLLYIVMVFVIYGFYYTEQIRNNERQKRFLEKRLLDTKLQLLSTQMHPHFLFNTLNAIVSLIKSQPDKAIDTLVDLSYFLRKILELKDTQFVLAKEEFKILNKYLKIIDTRFEEQVKICKEIDPEILETKIPMLIIQPMVENAIKHGFYPGLTCLIIVIRVKMVGDKVEIIIKNNGKKIDNPATAFSRGNGLSNIYGRLEALYDGEFTFLIENNNDGEGIINKIIIPNK